MAKQNMQFIDQYQELQKKYPYGVFEWKPTTKYHKNALVINPLSAEPKTIYRVSESYVSSNNNILEDINNGYLIDIESGGDVDGGFASAVYQTSETLECGNVYG